ncbi:acyltransferase [Acinetobacter soli]|uniref:acyltransferase n=1 Tax=Acinetobacter soli TaxID=487316 RepID=UPI001C48546D|nr:acyltransferase [Acinetobacter soli]MBV6550773.1 acyltransferase [Acinetobacter soli]
MKNLYNKLFVAGATFSLLKTIIHRFFILKDIRKKLYTGYRTKIIKHKSAIIDLSDNVYIDARNDGQFYYYSSIRLKENSRLIFKGEVNFFSGLSLKIFENACIEVDNGTYFSGPITLHSKKKIIIGKNCAISWNCTIIDSNFHKIDYDADIVTKEINIGDRVWIGNNVIILPGSVIENDVIIGAGSVVKGHLLENGIYAGNPAKLIRFRKGEK